MGAWDVGPFENDNAMDWCGNLRRVGGVGLLRATLESKSPGPLGVSYACEVVAAIEVVAACGGRPCPDFPPKVAGILGELRPAVDRSMRDLAQRRLVDVAESDLRGLWNEAGLLREWLATLDDLRVRLEA